MAPKFAKFVNENITKLTRFIEVAHQAAVPALAMTGAFNYILQLASPIMISAQVSALQRDFFGAHGYFIVGGPKNPEIEKNKEGKMREFHTEWMLPGRPEREITK
jgi:6-phosphogluconate dehydrogenase